MSPPRHNEKKENALQLLNRISAQFHIGQWTDPDTRTRSKSGREAGRASRTVRETFVANTKENLDWLAKLPKSILECVSLERVTTTLGSVERVQPTSNKAKEVPDLTPAPKGFNHSQIVLCPTKGDVEQWLAAASFCCGYLCVIEDSYRKARKFDFHTATTPFRRLYEVPKGQQVKWIKYYTAAPMSQILGEVLPSTPTTLRTPVFFSGKFRKFMHQRCLPTTKDTRNYRNAFNLLQGVKKACQPISADFVKSAFEEHRITMATPCEIAEDPDQSIYDKYQDLWTSGRWGPHFQSNGDIDMGRWDRFKPVLFKPPGPSATLEWGRKEGGGSAYAYSANALFDKRERCTQEFIVNVQIMRAFSDRLGDDAVETIMQHTQGWVWPEPPDPPTMEVVREDEDDTHNVQRDLQHDTCRVRPREPTVPEARVNTDGERYLSWRNYSPNWEETFQLYDKHFSKVPTVMVEGCVEPIKLRTITKGPCHRKWLSQSLQREMADCLDGFWQFSLNKANSDARLVSKLHDRCELFHRKYSGDPEPTLWWCSGDYKSATDSISIHHTKAALETLLNNFSAERVSEACKRLYRAELYEQLVQYPPWTGIQDVQQVNGQLMGSVLSFPILCVINFVAYWVSLEEFYGRKFKVREIPCLIHGDDILFRTTQEHYDHWSDVILRFGLKKSVGKNYFHPKVFTVDSELWIEGKSEGKVHFTKHTPINCGSLLGSRVDGRTAYQNAPIWDKFNSSIRGAQDKELFVKRFVHFNRAIIKPMTWTKSGVLNLFLPQMRGGIGFELPWKADQIPTKEDGQPLVRLTKHQLDLASALCNSMRESGPLKALAIVGVQGPKGPLDEKRYRLPFKETWEHESSYAREIPNDVAEPILSSLPESRPDEFRLRKPNLGNLVQKSNRFRLCRHPPIEAPHSVPILEDVKTYPTEIFSFPYVRARSIDPEDFWAGLVWGFKGLREVRNAA